MYDELMYSLFISVYTLTTADKISKNKKRGRGEVSEKGGDILGIKYIIVFLILKLYFLYNYNDKKLIYLSL
jgi:hypothetical protein